MTDRAGTYFESARILHDLDVREDWCASSAHKIQARQGESFEGGGMQGDPPGFDILRGIVAKVPDVAAL